MVAKRSLHMLLACCVAMISLGCGGGKNTTDPSDPQQVKDQLNKEARKHHPSNFGEVDLGEFFVVHKRDKKVLYIRFHMIGVVPNEEQAGFTKAMNSHMARMKETVVRTVRGVDRVVLADPRMGSLRTDLIKNINEVMNTRALRNIVFTSLSVNRG